MIRPVLTDEALEASGDWISCPEQYCDDTLDGAGYCLTCDREYPYCPVCRWSSYSEDAVNGCYKGCATVLDRIVDALDFGDCGE